jgi:hypothetical protein
VAAEWSIRHRSGQCGGYDIREIVVSGLVPAIAVFDKEHYELVMKPQHV